MSRNKKPFDKCLKALKEHQILPYALNITTEETKTLVTGRNYL